MIESNLKDVISDIEDKLKELGNADRVLRQACFDAVALISDRVQQRGEKTDETKIGDGKYSQGYDRKREKKGLQDSFIDLTFTGDMMGDFVPVKAAMNAFDIGFRGQLSSNKSEWNEAQFGTIYHMSNSEKEIVLEAVNESVNEIFR